uniref:Uncharacterized protein n=1 Tax=Glossina pallidipes TaxID=7398 RepID=A0A1B0ACK5_GLOPL
MLNINSANEKLKISSEEGIQKAEDFIKNLSFSTDFNESNISTPVMNEFYNVPKNNAVVDVVKKASNFKEDLSPSDEVIKICIEEKTEDEVDYFTKSDVVIEHERKQTQITQAYTFYYVKAASIFFQHLSSILYRGIMRVTVNLSQRERFVILEKKPNILHTCIRGYPISIDEYFEKIDIKGIDQVLLSIEALPRLRKGLHFNADFWKLLVYRPANPRDFNAVESANIEDLKPGERLIVAHKLNVTQFVILEKKPYILYLNTCIRGYPKGLRADSDPRKSVISIDEHFEKRNSSCPTINRGTMWGCGDKTSREVELDIRKWHIKKAERQRTVKLTAADWMDHSDRFLFELGGNNYN